MKTAVRGYLNVPLQLLQEVLLALFSHVQLLPFVEEVVIFECWQVLSLGGQQQGQVRRVNPARTNGQCADGQRQGRGL